jgi:superfamily II helicase
MDAMYRTSCGKGRERHASGDEPFEEQFILRGARIFGLGGLQFQIAKKIEETVNITDYEARINEFLDIMVYSAAAVIRIKEIIKERKTGIPV